MTKLTIAITSLALCAIAGRAHAQAPRPIELGADAGVTIGLGDNSFTTIDIPVQSFRAGFPISPRSSLEPKISLHVFSDNGTSTDYRAELGWLYHFGSSRYPGAYQRAGAYVRPFAGLQGHSDGVSTTDGLLGAGLGFKMPLVSRLSGRFEANFAHLFGDSDSNQLGLLAGLSFFTR
ncbi:MAG TPA: outer membrane beta-barrel protein [Gemmatimonadaceae bacterium]|nr:outer membrane beta-barrel protein [Gemmatimonadaceae bacterium]